MDINVDVNDMWGIFRSILCECLDSFALLDTVVSKHSCHPTSWMTPELLSLIKKKNKLNDKLNFLSVIMTYVFEE